jgi:uncharacterized protein (DUF1684 family)
MNPVNKSLALAGLALLTLLSATAGAGDPQTDRTLVEQWRTQREDSLTSDTGWLTLAGLFWLKPGENTFGRDPSNMITLNNAALADSAGSFILNGNSVRFVAIPGSHITYKGETVATLNLVSDASADPTVLESGRLQFFVIERAGNFGIRIRDLDNPRRKAFRGIDYFPVNPAWVLIGRFVPYAPHHHTRIVNILGMEQEMDCPGAVVFSKDGKTWRLDAVLENPQDDQLFIMFADGTSSHETYGGGRFLYAPLPHEGKTVLDFNKAHNPPCAFNDFATCPLPPYQNRLTLRIDAGEKTYAGGHDAPPR